MDFLLRVRRRVEELQSAGRRVVVAGDLNLKLRPFDSVWLNRHVDLAAFRRSSPVPEEPSLVARLRAQLAGEEDWKKFVQRLGEISEVESRGRYVYRLDNKQLKSKSVFVSTFRF
jgi:exonuclease III